MYKCRLFVVVFLVGCMNNIPGEQRVEEYFPEELEVAQTQLGRSCSARGLTFTEQDDKGFHELCPSAGPEGRGCHLVATWPDRDVLVVNKRYLSEERNTITHEVFHWLAKCSGMHRDSDKTHTDPVLWSNGGALDRTNRALGLPHD